MTKERGDMKATLHHEEERHVLRFERRLAHPPEKVWRALTENDELAHWFPAVIHGAREPGAALRFIFPEEPGQVPADSTGEGTTLTGEMLAFDPPRVLEYSWGGELLRWELQPSDEGTLLIFTHTFEDLAKAARDASGWEVCLGSLASRLAGAPPEPFTSERFDALFADYARRFGAEASARRTPDGD